MLASSSPQHQSLREHISINSKCKRRIFTERLPQITAPWARRTRRFAQHLVDVALALGGAAGERLSQKLSGGVSRNTLLRLVSRLPLPTIVTPEALGVDNARLPRFVSVMEPS